MRERIVRLVQRTESETTSNSMRSHGAWRSWLTSLATDAQAATAAAHLYAELPDDVRDAWLDALDEDAPKLAVPRLAVYGPLLAVEQDPMRRKRMSGEEQSQLASMTAIESSLVGNASGGDRVAALVVPMYLEFVRVIYARYDKKGGFEWVRQTPLLRRDDAPVCGSVVDDVKLQDMPVQIVVDELAHAVLAHQRAGLTLPQLLRDCADLFAVSLPG